MFLLWSAQTCSPGGPIKLTEGFDPAETFRGSRHLATAGDAAVTWNQRANCITKSITLEFVPLEVPSDWRIWLPAFKWLAVLRLHRRRDAPPQRDRVHWPSLGEALQHRHLRGEHVTFVYGG